MKFGMYRESMNVPEEKVWGMMLADVAHHAANALEAGYGAMSATALKQTWESFIAEVGAPTSAERSKQPGSRRACAQHSRASPFTR
jgi:hypothetical protein